MLHYPNSGVVHVPLHYVQSVAPDARQMATSGGLVVGLLDLNAICIFYPLLSPLVIAGTVYALENLVRNTFPLRYDTYLVLLRSR